MSDRDELRARSGPEVTTFKKWKECLIAALILVLTLGTFIAYGVLVYYLASILGAAAESTVSNAHDLSFETLAPFTRSSASTPVSTSQEKYSRFIDHAFQELYGREASDNSSEQSSFNGDNVDVDNPYNAGWWAEIQEAGSCLVTRLLVKSIPDSEFTKYSDIAAAGYQGGSLPQSQKDKWRSNIDPLISQYEWNWDNFQGFFHSMDRPRGTGLVQNTILVNPIDGVIVALMVFGISQSKGPPQPPGLLQRLSDYMYLVYQQACFIAGRAPDACMEKLEWVIHTSITNIPTQQVSRWAATGGGGRYRYPAWPGTIYTMSDSRGAAFLAAPNGVGVTYLCGAHKNSLMGQKIPDYVHAFSGLIGGNLNLAYHLSDYEPGILEKPPTGDPDPQDPAGVPVDPGGFQAPNPDYLPGTS